MAMALTSVSCSCSILLLSLQLLVRIHGGVAIRDIDNKETNILKLPSSMEQGMEHHHHHHHASNNLETMIFFTLKDLYQGNSLPIYFPKRNPSSATRKLLPRDEADSIPFALEALPYLLSFFSFSPNSPQAAAMEATLSECEMPPIEGETKFCATSVESMLEFVQGMFRKMDGETTPQIKAIATVHVTESNIHFQNYTIVEVDEVAAPTTVPCHTMPYPYMVYYCHHQTTESKVFRVPLAGENGDKVEAVAVCHLDTSHWNRKHPAFGVLGIKPGESHVCHFFPADNFVWVPVA